MQLVIETVKSVQGFRGVTIAYVLHTHMSLTRDCELEPFAGPFSSTCRVDAVHIRAGVFLNTAFVHSLSCQMAF